MKLNHAILNTPGALPGYRMPAFDRPAMLRRTAEAPTWLHFGSGNIFRMFPAVLCQRLLNDGLWDTGVICCEGYDGEIVEKSLRPFDNLAAAVTLLPDGSVEKEIVGSIAESLTLPADLARVQELFRRPSLRMVSFTITEKGYAVRGGDGELLPAVASDLESGPQSCRTFLGQLVACCLGRFEAGGTPLALVSMDNCSHNGEKLSQAFFTVLDGWRAHGFVSEDACGWARKNLSFPWSMIDKITPRPSEAVEHVLETDGLENMEILVTAKHSYTAPFVNAEKPQYLVIEDDFPNGRPPLEKAGVLFTTRDTVNAVESMKVCTCLNPLHTALAVFGCLLGYTSIAAEMQDGDLRSLITEMAWKEGMPVVIDPGVIRPADFLREVLEQRFPNPFLPDTPQRIATDTSQKIPVRYGVDLRLHQERGDAGSLVRMPLVLAGWLRYLRGVDDGGAPFECSPDPLLARWQPVLRAIPFGEQASAGAFGGLLEETAVWGVDLREAGLLDRVVADFNRLNEGPGAVRRVLHELAQQS